jgi:hypothetical protein
LTLGGLAMGLLPFGGFSFGLWALGAFAVGFQAFGVCAIGWKAATGAVAVAREFALGPAALAQHANNDAAQAFVQSSTFFHNAQTVMQHAHWINLVVLLPLVLWWRTARNRHQNKA